MADQVKISGLPGGSTLAAANLLAAVQSGVTNKITGQNVLDYINASAEFQPVDYQLITSATDVTLTNPIKQYYRINITAPGQKVLLPPLGAANSPQPGTLSFLQNISVTHSFDIYQSDGVTPVKLNIQPDAWARVHHLEPLDPNGPWEVFIMDSMAGQSADNVDIGGGEMDGVTIGSTEPVQIQGYRPINTQTGTFYTLVITDAGKLVTLENAAAISVSVPPNASVTFPIGTEIDLAQLGAGQVTVLPGVGVTLNRYLGLPNLAGQYAVATLKKIETNRWLLFGNLA